MYIKRKIIFHEECVGMYRVMVLFGITYWYSGMYAADVVKMLVDDGCATYEVYNQTGVDVQVFIERKAYYKRLDEKGFSTSACSGGTPIKSGKRATMPIYRPDSWVQNWLLKYEPSAYSPSDFYVDHVECKFFVRVVQSNAKTVSQIRMKRCIMEGAETLILEALSARNEQNSCAE
jgi:hypothetical protein